MIYGTTRQTECGFIVSLETWCGSVCGVDPVCPFEKGDWGLMKFLQMFELGSGRIYIVIRTANAYVNSYFCEYD